jgi:hypothetical protein
MTSVDSTGRALCPARASICDGGSAATSTCSGYLQALSVPHIHLVGTKRNDPAIPGEGTAVETTDIVKDETERAQPLDEARDHVLS